MDVANAKRQRVLCLLLCGVREYIRK